MSEIGPVTTDGAEIKGSFGNNRDTAQILPDGSFHLKIDYEYREDEGFVIVFDPQWQWNEIEEAYGTVKTNQYNDKQTIEKVIPWSGTEE